MITRREFVGGVCAVGAAAALPGRSAWADVQGSGAEPDGFSFVHLTDMHVTPRRWGDKGYRACIESVRALEPKPAFALMGGDLAFDGLYTSKGKFEEQIRLYKEVSDGLGMPYYNCMGNHDALGWSNRRKVKTDDPELGKKLIMDRLEWEKSYYSFDYGGWHFVVLDSIFPKAAASGPTYEPRLGPEQLEWLRWDLGAAGGRPTVAVTHIAAFCNQGQIYGDPQRKAMDGFMVLWDTRELRTILERHGVKALLQGHSHQIEEYRYHEVSYVTSAAVSGAWWSGQWNGTPPGYTVFHCRGDRLTWEHVRFPWTPHLEPEDTLERQKTQEYEAERARQQALLAEERAGRRP